MLISRKGAAANHGVRSVDLKDLKFKFQVNNDTLMIKSDKPASDFATDSRHMYSIKMTLAEVADLISALADGCAEIDTDLLREELRPKVPDMMKIVTLASNS